MASAQKKAVRERRELIVVDEAAFYLLPGVLKTYAPCGHTPELRVRQSYDHWSVISGVTLDGGLYTQMHPRAIRGTQSVQFVQHVQRHLGPRLLVIWDGAPIHRGQAVQDFLAAGGAGAVHLEQLPAYAPELNPDEAVWRHLKYVDLGNLCCQDLQHLQHELYLALRRLRRKPELIRAFFTEAGLAL